jgi:sortase A
MALVIASAATLLFSACGRSTAPTAEARDLAGVTTTAGPRPTAPPVPTAAPTTRPTTSTSSTTSSSTSTSTSSTTIAAQATEPITPPTDERADEPVIEMGTISIPAIGVEMTMYEGIRLSTLDHGPGHWPGSALPGQPGNVVVAGHRTSKHRVFHDVDQLVAGDEIIFDDASGHHVYRVSRVEIVDPTALWIVDPTPTPTATLFACHPPGSTTQRIAVFADLVD